MGSSGPRTIKGFSTQAESKMYNGCPGCPYHHYSQFYDYYGDFDYADKWVTAALDGTAYTPTNAFFEYARPSDASMRRSTGRAEAAVWDAVGVTKDEAASVALRAALSCCTTGLTSFAFWDEKKTLV